jgi:hypothetical protein
MEGGCRRGSATPLKAPSARARRSDAKATLCSVTFEQLRQERRAAPAIAVQRDVCDDATNPERYGTEYGTTFALGEGAHLVELHVPDATEPNNYPIVYMLSNQGIDVEDMRALLSNLLRRPQLDAEVSLWFSFRAAPVPGSRYARKPSRKTEK